MTIQEGNKDFTSTTFLSGVDFDLNGQTGVKFNLADIDGRTITDSGSGGTYILEDIYATIHAAADQTGGTAADKPKFKALFGATEIHITDYETADSMARLTPTLANVKTAYTDAGGSGDPATTDIQVTIADNTTITDTIGASINNVTKVSVAAGKTLTIESDVLDNSANEWSTLTTITGQSGSTETLAISNGGATTIDLYGISTLTNMDVVTIADTTGADTINLSPTLTTESYGGNTTINLSSGDNAGDKIFFGVDDANFYGVETGGDVINYSIVNNFEVGYDRIGLYYYGDTDSPVTAVNATKRTGASSGVATMTTDRTFIEDDSNSNFKDLDQFNSVAEVKAQIATALSSFTENSPSSTPPGENRLMYAHYTYSETDSANYAVINAADFSGVSSSSDITTSADFEVVGIAALAGVAEGSLGTFGGGLGGFNLTATKASTLGGAS